MVTPSGFLPGFSPRPQLGKQPPEARRSHHQSSGISLDILARATRGKVGAAVIQAELDRPSEDAQRTAQIMQAEAARLLGAGQPGEAVEMLQSAHRLARQAGVKNVYVSPILPWLATALRLEAEQNQENDPRLRDRLLKRGRPRAAGPGWREAFKTICPTPCGRTRSWRRCAAGPGAPAGSSTRAWRWRRRRALATSTH